jgi:hypothetical protein
MFFKVDPRFALAAAMILALPLFLHNLNWGAPWYFHPDEKTIALAVTRLEWRRQMNPQFFAYGSLPIYAIYFCGTLANLTAGHTDAVTQVSYETAILASRAISAALALALIPLLFAIGKRLRDAETGAIAACLAATSVGFVQFSHFGTFEMWLTFLSSGLLFCCLGILRQGYGTSWILAAVLYGALVGTKIVAVPLAVLPVISLALWHATRATREPRAAQARRASTGLLLFGAIAIGVYLATNPYVVRPTADLRLVLRNPLELLNSDFVATMKWESALQLGKQPIYFTGEFFDTTPLLFQLAHVYPFLLNPVVLSLFLVAGAVQLRRALQRLDHQLIIVLLFWLVTFLSLAFAFAKWIRYYVWTLPFMYLIVALLLRDLGATLSKWNVGRRVYVTGACALLGANLLFAFAYWYTAFVAPDTRVAASQWLAKRGVARTAPAVAEFWDLSSLPFEAYFEQLTLFDFYELDGPSSAAAGERLEGLLQEAEYIVLPSQRVLKTRLLKPHRFPNGHLFYQNLVSGALGFTQIYETPCDVLCRIAYLGSPDYAYEETANVFDRPTVRIFKKRD